MFVVMPRRVDCENSKASLVLSSRQTICQHAAPDLETELTDTARFGHLALQSEHRRCHRVESRCHFNCYSTVSVLLRR